MVKNTLELKLCKLKINMRSKLSFSSLLTKRKILIVLSVIFALAIIVVVLEKSNVTNFYTKDIATTEQETEKTTSNTETAQEEFTDGEYREPGNSIGEDEGFAEVVDSNGWIDSSVNTNNPTKSASGEIEVYAPAMNSLLKSGYTIAGSSSLQRVSYRIIDNVSGMIASGELSVVNGKFSGKINFNTTANEGRLDIYGTKSDMAEFSNIEIPVRFTP